MFSSKKYPWLVVALLWGVGLLNYLDRQMLSTMKPAIMIDIPELQSATHFGRLMAVFLWIYGFMSPVAGWLADRISKSKLIFGSLLVWSLVTLLMGFSTRLEELYVLRALMGFSEALYLPAGLALIAEYHSDRSRSLAVGIHMTGLYMGQALGGFGATLSKAFSWSHVFLFFGLVGVAYALALFWLLKDPPGADKGKRERSQLNLTTSFSQWGSLFKSISFWVILFYFAIPSLPGWAIKNWLPTLFADKLHYDMAVAGPMATISIASSSLLGVIIGGLLSDRWVRVNIRGRVYTSALGLALTLPALIFIGWGNQAFFILGAAVCFGIGFGMFDANNMPILCQIVPAQQRASAYGLMNMTGVFAGALITDIMGRSIDAGRSGGDFVVMASLVLLALFLQLLFLRPNPPAENSKN